VALIALLLIVVAVVKITIDRRVNASAGISSKDFDGGNFSEVKNCLPMQ
jgi:hypothetical protein